LRAQYGWEDGGDVELGDSNYNYTYVYSDLGYFAEETTNLIFYGEARQGRTFNIEDQFLVSPHLVIDGRTQQRDTSASSYVEAGAGVSLNFLFNETQYESYRSSLEGLIQYKFSIDNAENGIVLTGILRF
jgi:Bacteriophage N adsorption protein A C-term